MRRIHFEQLCFVCTYERKKTGIGKVNVTPGTAAHQRRCIIVVVQPNDMAQFVGNNIACEAGQRLRIFPKTGDCNQGFPSGWPRGRECVETVLLGQGDDHVPVRFPDAVQDSRRHYARLCSIRTEVVGRDRSKTLRWSAQAERASKLGKLGVPEIDRLANGGKAGIILGRQDDYLGNFLPQHPLRGMPWRRLRMRTRRPSGNHAHQTEGDSSSVHRSFVRSTTQTPGCFRTRPPARL